MSLDDFLVELKNCDSDDKLLDFCRKYVLHGTPIIFTDNETAYYEFRKKIANKYGIIFHEIYIVGSAKLGFSPHKRKDFDYESDIDVAIISESLFDEMLEIIRGYQMELRKSRKTISSAEIKTYHEFLEYMAMGWIRTDKLPISFKVNDFKQDWFEFFKSISYGKSEVGNYKVAAGVFKTYTHLEDYTLSGLKELKKSIEIGEYNVTSN